MKNTLNTKKLNKKLVTIINIVVAIICLSSCNEIVNTKAVVTEIRVHVNPINNKVDRIATLKNYDGSYQNRFVYPTTCVGDTVTVRSIMH
jgi:hypothetical protein